MKKIICLGFSMVVAISAGSSVMAAQPLSDSQMKLISAGAKVKNRRVSGNVSGSTSGSLAAAIGGKTTADTSAKTRAGHGKASNANSQKAKGKFRFSAGAGASSGAKVSIKNSARKISMKRVKSWRR